MNVSSLFNVHQLGAFTSHYSFYTTLIILIIGFLGNILNLIVFFNLKMFQKNPCAFYIMIESLVNTIQLFLLFLTQFLVKLNHGIDPANQSLLWCKIRTVISQLITLLSFSIVCFAAYDQFLSTNHQYYLRQMSTYKAAQYLIFSAQCLYLIHSIPFAIFLDINSCSDCVISNPAFRRYYQFFYYLILIGILPVSISSFFSFFAFRNVRRLVRRQISIIRRRLDRQLTAMILIRTSAFVLCILPYAIYRIYCLQIESFHREVIQRAIDSLIEAMIISLFNLNFAVSFYLFSISSSRFRRQVKFVLVKKLWRRWCRFTRNQLASITTVYT